MNNIIHFNFYWKLIRYPSRNVPWLLMLHLSLVKSGNLKPLNTCRILFKLSQRIIPLTFVISLPKQVPSSTFVFENSPTLFSATKTIDWPFAHTAFQKYLGEVTWWTLWVAIPSEINKKKQTCQVWKNEPSGVAWRDTCHRLYTCHKETPHASSQ